MRANSFLLVHGSWHGPWCWDHLLPELTGRGHDAITVALPSCAAGLGDYAADVAAVTAAAADIQGDVVVVGHSYGGAVISGARFGDNVRQLVFVGAFMPDSGRNYVSYLPPGPLPPYVGLREDGTMTVPDGQARKSFYGDCTDETAKWAESMLRPQSQAVLEGVVTEASWRGIPSSYIVTTQDRALPPDFQRMFAAQATEVVEFESSHSPMLSRPADFAELLVALARTAVAS